MAGRKKFPSRAVLEIVRREHPGISPAAGLIITARESRVNSSNPSSSPAMTEFMFSPHGAEYFMHPAQLFSDP